MSVSSRGGMIHHPPIDESDGAATRALARSAQARLVGDAFRARVLEESFACLGARSALGSGRSRISLYADMGDSEGTRRLARDLARFAGLQDTTDHTGFSSFVAAFTGPMDVGEGRFEQKMWQQLQDLHDVDARVYGWDPCFSSDPDDPSFAFSIGGRAFFVVGLHGRASRVTRRFAWPTLVFNPHDQFTRLRSTGRFDRLQEKIRERDLAIQGSLNPMLGDFGIRSEARQYAGRAVEDDWRCPFRRHEAG